MQDQKHISITVIQDGREQAVTTYANEYRNLMVLLNNSIYLEGFGECGGQGRCATCMVNVTGLQGAANMIERNEKATIEKSGIPHPALRLSCQVLINAELDGAVVEIVEE